MTAFKQFSMAIFTMAFVLGLLFDILNREIPDQFVMETVSLEEAGSVIVNTISSTFAIDAELSSVR